MCRRPAGYLGSQFPYPVVQPGRYSDRAIQASLRRFRYRGITILHYFDRLANVAGPLRSHVPKLSKAISQGIVGRRAASQIAFASAMSFF